MYKYKYKDANYNTAHTYPQRTISETINSTNAMNAVKDVHICQKGKTHMSTSRMCGIVNGKAFVVHTVSCNIGTADMTLLLTIRMLSSARCLSLKYFHDFLRDKSLPHNSISHLSFFSSSFSGEILDSLI